MALDEARRVIRDEMTRLTREMAQLKQALAYLDGGGQSEKPRRRRRVAKVATKAAPDGRRGARRQRLAPAERQQQLVTVIKERPGISQADLARRVGLTASHVGGIVRQLEQSGQVNRTDGGLLAR